MTDPQAAWVARPGVDPLFAYDANYLIDNKVGIILDAEGTRTNRTVEIAVAQTMVERVKRRFGLRPQRLAGDTADGAVKLLKWLIDHKIAPHTLRGYSARRDGTFSRADFAFNAERNIYVCPSGKALTSTGNIDQGHIVYYRASKRDCFTFTIAVTTNSMTACMSTRRRSFSSSWVPTTCRAILGHGSHACRDRRRRAALTRRRLARAEAADGRVLIKAQMSASRGIVLQNPVVSSAIVGLEFGVSAYSALPLRSCSIEGIGGVGQGNR